MGTYSIIRPYPGTLGRRVEEFATRLNLTPALGDAPRPGTPDGEAARFVARTVAQLVIVPFHFHRGPRRSHLDGIGVLLELPAHFDVEARVLLMPVRDFSYRTTFEPRRQELERERPELAEHLICVHEGDLESLGFHARVKLALEAVAGARSRTPSVRPKRRPTIASGLADQLSERFSLPPTSRTRRSSGGWKFSLPQDPDEEVQTLSPPSGLRAVDEARGAARPIYQDYIDDKKSSG